MRGGGRGEVRHQSRHASYRLPDRSMRRDRAFGRKIGCEESRLSPVGQESMRRMERLGGVGDLHPSADPNASR